MYFPYLKICIKEKYKLPATIEHLPSLTTRESFEIPANTEIQYNVKKTRDENIKSNILYIKPYCANIDDMERDL